MTTSGALRACHGATGAGHGTAGEGARIFARLPHRGGARASLRWFTHGVSEHGMPAFESRLEEAQRWNVINFIRALDAADGLRRIGRRVEPDRAWLVAPDFTISVGLLTPRAPRDYRGQRMVLLVLYTLPESRDRMATLARRRTLRFSAVLGHRVAPHASPEAIGELGSRRTVCSGGDHGNADIV